MLSMNCEDNIFIGYYIIHKSIIYQYPNEQKKPTHSVESQTCGVYVSFLDYIVLSIHTSQCPITEYHKLRYSMISGDQALFQNTVPIIYRSYLS